MPRRRFVALVGFALLAGGVYMGYVARRAEVAPADACEDPAYDHVLPMLSSRAAFLEVRAGEPFSVPVPEEARVGLGFELSGEDVRFREAEGEGAWSETLAGCHAWAEGERPAEVGRYVADRTTNVSVALAPLR